MTPLLYALVGGGVAVVAAAWPWFVGMRGHVSMQVLDAQLRKLYAAGNAPRARKLLSAGPHAVYMRCLAAAHDAAEAGDWPTAQRVSHARSAFNERFRAEAEAIARRLPLLALALAGAAVGVWAVALEGARWEAILPGVLAIQLVLSTYVKTRRLARECPAYAEAIYGPMVEAIERSRAAPAG
jgi:hypothetical protein